MILIMIKNYHVTFQLIQKKNTGVAHSLMLGTGKGCHDITHRCGQRVPWRWIDRILSVRGDQAMM
jgi:hypothetical protein